MKKKAIIIGAGPAGLTAAYELLKRTDIKPVILEKSPDIGGISKTVNYKGNRIDIGGHRFFSKSDRVMNWWFNIMPIQKSDDTYTTITYQRHNKTIKQEETDIKGNVVSNKVMLIRKRLSRIYFLRNFFSYPIQLSIDTLSKLGLSRTVSILVSYLKAQIFKRKPEKNLEEFLINRFGVKLYRLFFKDYTEKVWGVPCKDISSEWGSQRIKGVSVSKAMQHALKMIVNRKKEKDIGQKNTETSLIEQFLYPALGPGQLWEEVARQVVEMGGEIIFYQNVKELHFETEEEQGGYAESSKEILSNETLIKNQRKNDIYGSMNIDPNISTHKHITRVTTVNTYTNEYSTYEADYFFSTMPVQELIAGMNGNVPNEVKEIAAGLQYRDFITVGVLLKKLTPPDSETSQTHLPDTWIYIQEKDVKVGRLQIFNNWSPFMVNDPDKIWIGMEYFCNTTDEFWQLSNSDIQQIAVTELEKMGLAKVEDVLDSTVLRMEKTYPAYFGTYTEFDKIRTFVDEFENLFLIGRNGMHKYNNSDHSMLTAMVSVDNICNGITSKKNIWEINTEQEYHEVKSDKNKILENSSKDSRQHEKSKLLLDRKTSLSLKEYVLNNSQNRFLFLSALAVTVILFSIFKYFYPFASFINGDSYVYLETATNNLSVNVYPVGYSNFLRLVSVFTKSDTILVAIQYFFLQTSILTFLFTIFFFYEPRKITKVLLLSFFVLNPVFLHISNYISSDNIFISLSLIWITTLIWIIYRSSWKLLVCHTIVLFLAFTVRYNALIYPFIAGLAFLLSKERWHVKFAGFASSIILIGLFILHTGNVHKKVMGKWQFTAFTGWQMANNAMYTYRHIDSADRKPVPLKFKQLDNDIRLYFDSTRDLNKYPLEMVLASTMYMWSPNMPLQTYMRNNSKNDTTLAKRFKRWASFGPLYNAYGWYIIKQYPRTFFKYYIWPNTLKFYAPPLEFLEKYSTGKDSVNDVAQQWFGYKSKKISTRLKDFKITVLNFMPIICGSLNAIFLFALLSYILLKGYNNGPIQKKTLILVSAFWLSNFAFSVFASPIALRFQLFPIIISATFTGLFIEHICKSSFQTETKNNLDETNLFMHNNIPIFK